MKLFKGICGLRKPRDISDLFPLDPEDTSDVIVPVWNDLWEAATKEYFENAKNLKKVVRRMPATDGSSENQSANTAESEKDPLLLATNIEQINSYYGTLPTQDSSEEQTAPKSPSIIFCLIRLFKREITWAMFLKLVSDLLQFANPQLLKALISFTSRPSLDLWYGVGLALLMFAVSELISLLKAQYYYLTYRLGTRIQTCLTAAIYRKALRLTNAARREKTVGEMVNLIAIDADLFQRITPQTHQYWSTPLQELSLLRRAAFLEIFGDMLNCASPFLVALSTFATFILSDSTNKLTPEITFVCLTLFNQLRQPMSTVAELITQTVQVMVSNQRLKDFLLADELDDYVETTPSAKEYAIIVQEASMTWDLSNFTPSLRNINFSVRRGSLVAIVGRVGTGKSSMLMSLMGEMERISGKIGVYGTIAYVSQQPWIQNQNVRQNIIFGMPYDQSSYERTLIACCLQPDMHILAKGDLTEIGEKGINLSGGQKSRVSLARAVYQNRDIYLLDDPLSAVDSHVGAQLFNNVIGPSGILQNKTRILVTHDLSVLKHVDQILIMSDGEIMAEGTYSKLMECEFFSELINQCKSENKTMSTTEPSVSHGEGINDYNTDSDGDDAFAEDAHEFGNRLGAMSLSTVPNIISRRRYSSMRTGDRRNSVIKKSMTSTEVIHKQLTGVEKVETGRVKMVVYYKYFEAMGHSLFFFFAIGSTASILASIARNIWLSDWSDESATGPHHETVAMRLGVYAGIGFAEIIFNFFGVSSLLMGGVAASRNLHEPLMHAIFRAPMSFFDTTPFGRILNRIGKDIETVDYLLPDNILFFTQCILQVVSTLLIIMTSTPTFVFVVIPLTAMYIIIMRLYISVCRQLKRYESISRSPIYSHLSESLHGCATIRAYNLVSNFCHVEEHNNDVNAQCRYMNYAMNRWLSIRLELIGNCVVLFTALLAVLTRDTISAGALGLSVSYSFNIIFVLNFAIRQISKLETNIVSVERIKEYSETPPEAEWARTLDRESPAGWPTKGTIQIKDYSTRYRPGLNFVIKGLNAEIHAGEKIGIVGRTGAGKSSVTLALFRMIEPCEGRIVIDDIDISLLGLHTLRSNITIIPQDPVLFSGTLRFNLDPSNQYSDEDIWRVLESSNLKQYAEMLPGKLQYEITENGDNISIGQRQLVCLARALLRKTKVLILDEATAAVDMATDAMIQNTIRKEFRNSTVITIAHRLNTIMDYDRIIVLEAGSIREFDSPSVLMANKKSVFYGMVRACNSGTSTNL
ncbi:ABC transporter transmembrane region domain-containing protein [Ditylenchus destructor]|uniref:ABC transporter transmembrane region domain-containing protein n=1 Tax=Ditylenchus destructor TaxID=166010 RepID=A0AAD4NBL8_9BILA|nr:ABC transporter transmembrane region domain-containing protein [Ditylenchus destructor]